MKKNFSKTLEIAKKPTSAVWEKEISGRLTELKVLIKTAIREIWSYDYEKI